jgi:hypothetical protein
VVTRFLRNLAQEYALRKEKGVFAYFCRRVDKSKASGGTQPAGIDFKNSQRKEQGQQINPLLPYLHLRETQPPASHPTFSVLEKIQRVSLNARTTDFSLFISTSEDQFVTQ